MSYIEQSLSRGENIEKVFKLHWTSYSFFVLYLILAIPTFGIFLFVAIYEYFRLKTLEYGATNKRVIFKKGIIARSTEEMKLGSIETVEIEQSILGRLFDFGTVKVSGRGISDVVFKGIDNPLMVKKTIDSIDEKE